MFPTASSGINKTNSPAANFPSVTAQNGVYNAVEESVEMNGTVVSDEGSPILERGFYYAIGDLTIDDTDTKEVVTGTTGVFSVPVDVIPQPTETYLYYRAFARNSVGETLSALTRSVLIPANT